VSKAPIGNGCFTSFGTRLPDIVLDCLASEGGYVQNPEDCSNKQPSPRVLEPQARARPGQARAARVHVLHEADDCGARLTLSERSECCGFGGTFSVFEEVVSTKMGYDKVSDHARAGAEYIVSADTSFSNEKIK
jgi:hypothetical protein